MNSLLMIFLLCVFLVGKGGKDSAFWVRCAKFIVSNFISNVTSFKFTTKVTKFVATSWFMVIGLKADSHST
jgi:hypothetical protein